MEFFKLQLMAGIVVITGILYAIPYLAIFFKIKRSWKHAKKVELYANYFVHGLMMALIFGALLPESLGSFNEITEKGQCWEKMENYNIVPLIFFIVLMGAILFNGFVKYIVDKNCNNKTHDSHSIVVCEMAIQESQIQNKVYFKNYEDLADFIPFISALFLHSILDGLLIGVLDHSSSFVAFFLAIIGHRICVTLTVSGKASALKNTPKFLHLFFGFLFVAAPALGIFCGAEITSLLSFCNTSIATIFINTSAAGILFEVIFFRLIPASDITGNDLFKKYVSVAFTMLGCIIMLIFGYIEESVGG